MRIFIITLLSVFALLGCGQKPTHQNYVSGEWDELFRDDGKFIPVNSAEIQRQLSGVSQ